MNQAQTLSDLTEEQQHYILNVGKCEFFDVKPFLEAANILVAADEPMRAIQLLDNLPGYYRDNVPKEVLTLKKEIYSLLATPAFYVTNKYDQLVREDNALGSLEHLLRGKLIEQDMKAFQEKGMIPHIVDLGPGEYWLPIALQKKGYEFTYQDIGLCGAAEEKAKKILKPNHISKHPLGGQPTMFIACELIEHLHHEEDIRADYERSGAKADIIHMSTPKYTFDGRATRLNWREFGDIGHLRTYTPMEFQQVVTRMFPGYTWSFYDSEILHMRGQRV